MNSQKLLQHLDSLSDISDIMSAMKYLSLMESNKLTRFIKHQERVVKSISFAATDFLNFHPEFLKEYPSQAHVIVILGSERGFCGNYNESLQRRVDEYLDGKENQSIDTKIVSIGYKLHNKFELYPQLYKKLVGPKLAEEIPNIINELIMEIGTLASKHQAIHLTLLYHNEDEPQPVFHKILPAFHSLKELNKLYATPPIIHLSTGDLFYALLDEYLFSSLNQIFYTAFLSENQYRIRHMENALNKLAENVLDLSMKRNEVRQEEITEELEVILLSSNMIESME